MRRPQRLGGAWPGFGGRLGRGEVAGTWWKDLPWLAGHWRHTGPLDAVAVAAGSGLLGWGARGGPLTQQVLLAP